MLIFCRPILRCFKKWNLRSSWDRNSFIGPFHLRTIAPFPGLFNFNQIMRIGNVCFWQVAPDLYIVNHCLKTLWQTPGSHDYIYFSKSQADKGSWPFMTTAHALHSALPAAVGSKIWKRNAGYTESGCIHLCFTSGLHSLTSVHVAKGNNRIFEKTL